MPPAGSGPTDPDYPLSVFKEAFYEALAGVILTRGGSPMSLDDAWNALVERLPEPAE